MSFADLAIYDRRGRLNTAVDIRAVRGTTTEWAAELRRNLLSHGDSPLQEAHYFLIVTPERIYLWEDVGDVVEAIPPTHEYDAKALLAPYFARTRFTPGTVSGYAFELLVGDWVSDLLRIADGYQQPAPDWARDSEWLESMRNGRWEFEPAA